VKKVTVRLRRLARKFDRHSIFGVAFVLLFAIAGVAALLMSSASTNSYGAEIGGGGTQSPATDVVDPEASGGVATLFGSKPSTCTNFDGPTIISRGGTYTGCWRSTDGVTPAIQITTSEPVVIVDSTIESHSAFIVDGRSGVNLTLNNSRLIGTTPKPPLPTITVPSRRAVHLARGAVNFRAEGNYLEDTSGFKITGWTGSGSTTNTIKVMRNKAKNITNQSVIRQAGNRSHLVQFVQIGQVNSISNVEISWNEVINKFGESSVEDNINLFQTGGTTTSPIKIHDNFIWGGFPETLGADYNGGGIIAGDSSYNLNIGRTEIFNNQVVGTTNYGIAIICGRDSSAYNNRVISSGRTHDNQLIAAANVGLIPNNATAWNGDCDPANYTNISFANNYVGWMNGNSRRNDWSFRCGQINSVGENILCASNISNLQVLPTNLDITYAMEQAEYTRWQQKVSSGGVVIGPR
jgi:chitinase